MPEDSRDNDDDDSEDGYSDRESSSSSIPRHVSHLLTAVQSATMFNASRPYLCNPNVMDRMCANLSNNSPNSLGPPSVDRYLSGRDRFVADSARTGDVLAHRSAVPAVDNEVDLHSYASGIQSGSGLRPALFDMPSDDEQYCDTESPAGEEAWQYVEDGEVELG
jgi:hypothetical protein